MRVATDQQAHGGDVDVRPAGREGLGVFARRRFLQGDVILRFEPGPHVALGDVGLLSESERSHLSELSADTCQILPAPRCFINHACVPNAYSTHNLVRAKSVIEPGEEITIDYRLNALDDWELTCECPHGSPGHKIVGDFFTLPIETQRAYLSEAPAFIVGEFRKRWSRSRRW